ncbi:MAG: hypothetical protein WCB11_02335 [Terriglobales bacterium]
MAEPAYNFQAMLRRFQSGELLEELCGIRQRMEKNLAEAVRLGDETRGMGMRLLPQPAKLGAIDPANSTCRRKSPSSMRFHTGHGTQKMI